jgi:hypothetical protein
MRTLTDQIPHFDLDEDIGVLDRRVVFATKSVVVEEAGLFGAELELGDGKGEDFRIIKSR